MKYYLFIATLVTFNSSFAATTFKFLPLNRNALAMVSGTADHDFADLYNMMNVPEQDGSMGKGKGLKSDDKAFNLACGASKSMCNVVVNKSAGVVIDPAKKCLSFSASGEAAAKLAALFLQNSQGEVHYLTSDKLLRIDASATSFNFEACQNGF